MKIGNNKHIKHLFNHLIHLEIFQKKLKNLLLAVIILNTFILININLI